MVWKHGPKGSCHGGHAHKRVIGFVALHSYKGFNIPQIRINVPLRGYDKHGRKVMVFQGSKTDPSKHSLDDQMRFSCMVAELWLKEQTDQACIMGMVGVQDFSGMTMGHAAQFSPAFGKKSMTVWQVIGQFWLLKENYMQ